MTEECGRPPSRRILCFKTRKILTRISTGYSPETVPSDFIWPASVFARVFWSKFSIEVFGSKLQSKVPKLAITKKLVNMQFPLSYSMISVSIMKEIKISITRAMHWCSENFTQRLTGHIEWRINTGLSLRSLLNSLFSIFFLWLGNCYFYSLEISNIFTKI